MKIFGISGLGADERVFDSVNRYLSQKIDYLPWIEPKPKESLKNYAHRMALTIDQSEPFSLVGVSFGGMIASEMNKVLAPEQTVIISSAACKQELPAYFRGAGKLNLIPFIPNNLLSVPKPLIDLVTSLSKEEDRNMVYDIMNNTDRDFLKWAVQSILTWDNEDVPRRLKRIHGSADRLIPLKTKADDVIDGGHLVVIERAEETARMIEKELAL